MYTKKAVEKKTDMNKTLRGETIILNVSYYFTLFPKGEVELEKVMNNMQKNIQKRNILLN